MFTHYKSLAWFYSNASEIRFNNDVISRKSLKRALIVVAIFHRVPITWRADRWCALAVQKQGALWNFANTEIEIKILENPLKNSISKTKYSQIYLPFLFLDGKQLTHLIIKWNPRKKEQQLVESKWHVIVGTPSYPCRSFIDFNEKLKEDFFSSPNNLLCSPF